MGNCHRRTKTYSHSPKTLFRDKTLKNRSYLYQNSNTNTKVEMKHDEPLEITFEDFIDHILLLRKVISHPSLTQDGKLLNEYIDEYCQKMAREEMVTDYQRSQLAWPILWIWYVHRLHPFAYHKDCTSQLPHGKLVDPKVQYFFSDVSTHRPHPSFIPSVNLTKAVIRQSTFLEKFTKHYLYTSDLQEINRSFFPGMVRNYISFLRLGKQNCMVVPTFDIDLIWHTHLRNPTHYRQTSIALCGFVLDHDDSIKEDILKNAYKNTANRWSSTYHTDYGDNARQNSRKTSTYTHSSANPRSFVSPVTNMLSSLHETSCDGGDCGGGGGGCSNCGGGGGGCSDSGGGGGCSNCGGGGGCSDSGGGGGCSNCGGGDSGGD
ncbi:unnamed protein product [Rotaria sordida]|uniref:Glycine-rich domain-containing protein-like n=1 Tax=Rotaria sordida TaxID=392033 RepID=A0A815SCZ1_9BILA|nr:unnamed protein product [Rotaria sordida]